MKLFSISAVLAQAEAPDQFSSVLHGPLPAILLLAMIVTACVFLMAIVTGYVFLIGLRRRRQLAGAGKRVAQEQVQGPFPLKEGLPEAEPYAKSCPVCGAELSGDNPEGLCPQCLMQCVLSQSEHGLEDEEKIDRGTPPNLPAAPTPAELAPHFPELEILELLGQGGMGAVYKARQRKLDRLVAVKVLPAEWCRDPAFAERFAREARALARLNHPQIVSVHDFGEASGHCFLIMEFVDGVNLRQLLTTGRLQPRQALPIVAQICDALQYAHEQGVIHRDIKPENILMDKVGRVKIADFGLAKLLRRSRNDFTLTGSRQVMGTLDYMAPEQRTAPQEVDHRADIYSLGVVFYEMLTGELPLGRFARPSEKVAVDGRLDDVIFRALEREPDRRYQRISAVKLDVESIFRAEAWTPAASGSPGQWQPDLAMAQLQTRGPAAGLIVVAILILIEVITILFAVDLKRRENPDGHIWLVLPEAGLLLIPLPLLGIIATGAVKLARCRGYEWAMIAIILIMLPLGFHFFVGFPIGLWALIVLRKPEVKAAFALNLRRALQAWQRPAILPARPVEQPTAPIRHKVRSFFLSMFSAFAPRSAIARGTPTIEHRPPTDDLVLLSQAAEQPAAEPSPAQVPDKGPRKGLTAWGLVGIGFLASWLILLAGCLIYWGARNDTGSIGASLFGFEDQSAQPTGLMIGDIDELATTVPLGGDRFKSVRQTLLGADREYLEMELRHTSRHKDPAGHLIVTIAPFPDELKRLEDSTWAKFDSILRFDHQERERFRSQLPARGRLFAFGQGQTHIELWHDDSMYHWRVLPNDFVLRNAAVGPSQGSSSGLPFTESGDGPQLPRRYQRFWCED
jgi:tRNA A-37 threonylcarbamoyl transferase component Bud32